MGKLNIISQDEVFFKNRREAGRRLGEELKKLCPKVEVVLGIPRGGIIIAAEIARVFNAELDIVIARKLGAPDNPELAVGALAENGQLFLNEALARQVGADRAYIQQEKQRRLIEIKRRVEQYRRVRPKVTLKGKSVVITDDGVATGATLNVALWAVRQEQPARLIVALPVGSEEAVEKISKDADEMICLSCPPVFYAVGQFYADFPQISDEEVLEILKAT